MCTKLCGNGSGMSRVLEIVLVISVSILPSYFLFLTISLFSATWAIIASVLVPLVFIADYIHGSFYVARKTIVITVCDWIWPTPSGTVLPGLPAIRLDSLKNGQLSESNLIGDRLRGPSENYPVDANTPTITDMIVSMSANINYLTEVAKQQQAENSEKSTMSRVKSNTKDRYQPGATDDDQ